MRIVVAGKGGAGKTLFCALLVAHLARAGRGPVLAVDADPNANLGGALGMPPQEAVGDIVTGMMGDRRSRPGGMSKERYLIHRVRQTLARGEGFDLLVMGLAEKAGCYCNVHHMLRRFVTEAAAPYGAVVMDLEPGLEHLNRRTPEPADMLFILSDASVRGVQSAGRVAALAGKLNLEIGRMGLVVNHVREGDISRLQAVIGAQEPLGYWGAIPHDAGVKALDLEGLPLSALPAESAVVRAVRTILREQRIL